MNKDLEINRCTVTISHAGQKQDLDVRRGLGLQAICAKTKTPIEFDCRKADCGICIVTVLKGGTNLSPPTPPERDFLKAMHADPEERLACQCRVLGPIAIEVAEI